MHRLYLDTCILNDAYVLFQHHAGEALEMNDLKLPLSRWIQEYVALRYILDLDDQWSMEFGTSDATLNEISRFRPNSSLATAKKDFLDEVARHLYDTFRSRGTVDSGSVPAIILTRIQHYLRPGYDSIHLGRAISSGWDFFITTDFRSLLNNQVAIAALERLVVETCGQQKLLWPEGETEIVEKVWGIKVLSPLQYLKRHWMPLPTLLRTLHGSWTDVEEVYRDTAAGLSGLIAN